MFLHLIWILISGGSKIPKYSFHQFHWEAGQRSASNYYIGSKYAELRCFKVESYVKWFIEASQAPFNLIILFPFLYS